MSTPRTQPAIQTRGLTKRFGDQVVLDGLDLDVAAGTVFALLGPNGAGKTTTVRILATQLRADAGEVRVAGHDPSTDADAVRAAIGVTGQFAAVDDLLTGAENLQLHGRSASAATRRGSRPSAASAAALRPSRRRGQTRLRLLGGSADASTSR